MISVHESLEVSVPMKQTYTAVFLKVATFNVDFASRDGNRAHKMHLGHATVISYAKQYKKNGENSSKAKSNVHFFVLKVC